MLFVMIRIIGVTPAFVISFGILGKILNILGPILCFMKNRYRGFANFVPNFVLLLHLHCVFLGLFNV